MKLPNERVYVRSVQFYVQSWRNSEIFKTAYCLRRQCPNYTLLKLDINSCLNLLNKTILNLKTRKGENE